MKKNLTIKITGRRTGGSGGRVFRGLERGRWRRSGRDPTKGRCAGSSPGWFLFVFLFLCFYVCCFLFVCCKAGAQGAHQVGFYLFFVCLLICLFVASCLFVHLFVEILPEGKPGRQPVFEHSNLVKSTKHSHLNGRVFRFCLKCVLFVVFLVDYGSNAIEQRLQLFLLWSVLQNWEGCDSHQ